MSERSLTCAPTCSMGVAARLVYGGATVFAAVFAASLLPADPVVAVAAGMFAVAGVIATITGRCPADWFAWGDRRHVRRNTLGFADAHEHVDLSQPVVPRSRSSHVHQ